MAETVEPLQAMLNFLNKNSALRSTMLLNEVVVALRKSDSFEFV